MFGAPEVSPCEPRVLTRDFRIYELIPPSYLTPIQRYHFPADLRRLEETKCCGDLDRRDHHPRRYAVGIVLLDDLPFYHSILRQILQCSHQMSDRHRQIRHQGSEVAAVYHAHTDRCRLLSSAARFEFAGIAHSTSHYILALVHLTKFLELPDDLDLRKCGKAGAVPAIAGKVRVDMMER